MDDTQITVVEPQKQPEPPKQPEPLNQASGPVDKLGFVDVLTSGIGMGVANIVPLLIAVLLWLLTIWIPYINVGTTIAIYTIPLSLSRGKVINPLFIFERKYRQYMGEFFLTCAFLLFGLSIAGVFLVIPAIVLFIAWSQAIYLVLDKGMNPAESLSCSNRLTSGNKWTIFGVKIILFLLYFAGLMLFEGFYHVTGIPYVAGFLKFCLMVVYTVGQLGIDGVIYNRLSRQLETQE